MTGSAVIISGAEGGIGKALCQAFGDAGYYVIGTDRERRDVSVDAFLSQDLDDLVRSPKLQNEIVERLAMVIRDRPLGCLVNNAAFQIVRPLEQLSGEDWQRSLNINVLAPFLLTKLLLPRLERAHGSVINIASIHATLTKPEFVAYATSKAALVGLTRSMAVELGSRVRVNAICPAAIDTDMLKSGFVGREREFAQLAAAHPVGRIGTPGEVATFAVTLASPQFQFMSGGIFTFDGAISSRLHDPV